MKVLSEKTLVPIGLFFGFATVFLAATGYVIKNVGKPLMNFADTTEDAIEEIRKDVDAMKEDRYSLPMAVEDAFRLALRNPGLYVPDPRNPGQFIVVESARTVEGINP